MIERGSAHDYDQPFSRRECSINYPFYDVFCKFVIFMPDATDKKVCVGADYEDARGPSD